MNAPQQPLPAPSTQEPPVSVAVPQEAAGCWVCWSLCTVGAGPGGS